MFFFITLLLLKHCIWYFLHKSRFFILFQLLCLICPKESGIKRWRIKSSAVWPTKQSVYSLDVPLKNKPKNIWSGSVYSLVFLHFTLCLTSFSVRATKNLISNLFINLSLSLSLSLVLNCLSVFPPLFVVSLEDHYRETRY